MVPAYDCMFQPAASLYCDCHSVTGPKLVPVLRPHHSPSGPRPHTSSLPSPLMSANWMVDQVSGLPPQTGSLKAAAQVVGGAKLVPVDRAHTMPSGPRPHTSALPSPLRSGNWMV